MVQAFSAATQKRNKFYQIIIILTVVLLDPFREMRARRNSAETQQSGHDSRSEQEIKDVSSTKDGESLGSDAR